MTEVTTDTEQSELKPGMYCEHHGKVPAEQVDRRTMIHVRDQDGECGGAVTPVGGNPAQVASAKRLRDLEVENEKLQARNAELIEERDQAIAAAKAPAPKPAPKPAKAPKKTK